MHTCSRVVVVSGHDRQNKAVRRLDKAQTSPHGNRFTLDWLTPGYDPSRRSLAEIKRAIAQADFVLVSPRLGKILRGAAITEARRIGTIVVQINGAGTGLTGVLRQAAAAVDNHFATAAVAS